MAFIDLIQQLAGDSSSLVDRAGELRIALAADPNDRGAFEQLASIIRGMEEAHATVDPLTADEEDAGRTPVHLILWSLSEDLASDSRAWYPLLQLAKIGIDDDLEAAIRQISVAAGREETGEALARGISILTEAGEPDAAMQVGIGHWNPDAHIPEVGIELVKAAIACGKFTDAHRFVDLLLDKFPGSAAVYDIRDQLATIEEAQGE